MGVVSKSRFDALLSRHRRALRAGVFAGVLLACLAGAIAVLLAAGLLDRYLAFGAGVILAIEVCLALALAGGLVAGLAAVSRISAAHTAVTADRLLVNRRRAVQAAYELSTRRAAGGPAGTGMEEFLVGRSVEEAAAELGKLRFRHYYPGTGIGRGLRALLAVVALTGLLYAAGPEAWLTVAGRLAFPMRDMPPYSRMEFVVSPDSPNVFYGGDEFVSVRITGAPVKSQVWFLTRFQGTVRRTACFQEGDGRYGQRLEKLTAPIEFCFAAGKARSRWHNVNLLYRPRIALAAAEITPPAYTLLPARQLYIGGEDFAAMAGSRAVLKVVSNRPLLDGELAVKGKSGRVTTVQGRRSATDDKAVMFEWTIDEPAKAEVVIRDIRGTRNMDKYGFDQKIIADELPRVELTSPPLFSLATPATKLPVAGSAGDDIGLRKVELVRGVVGYKDRIKLVGPTGRERDVGFGMDLDLARLGVEPGQVLEFYAEAGDVNPSLMGVSASEVARVQVISLEEYAGLLRTKTTVEEFARRYMRVQELISGAAEALRKIDEAGDDAAKAEAARGEAIAKARAAAAELRKLSGDFAIYEVEKELLQAAGAAADGLDGMADKLDKLGAGNPDLQKTAREFLAKADEMKKDADDRAASMERLATIARIMERAAEYRTLVARQADLVRRISRFEDGRDKDVRLLESLGRIQNEIKSDLDKYTVNLRAAAVLLPPEAEKLRESALSFADKLGEAGIPGMMQSAVSATVNQDGREAYKQSALALEKMREMLKNREESGGQDGQGWPDFEDILNGQSGDAGEGMGQGMKETLAQMLQAILMRSQGSGTGLGMGSGYGMGYGGDAKDGFSMRGYSSLNVPMYGPGRTGVGSGAGSAGGSDGKRGGAGSRLGARDRETMERRETAGPGAESSVSVDQVPEKYRDAVKRYFSGGK